MHLAGRARSRRPFSVKWVAQLACLHRHHRTCSISRSYATGFCKDASHKWSSRIAASFTLQKIDSIGNNSHFSTASPNLARHSSRGASAATNVQKSMPPEFASVADLFRTNHPKDILKLVGSWGQVKVSKKHFQPFKMGPDSWTCTLTAHVGSDRSLGSSIGSSDTKSKAEGLASAQLLVKLNHAGLLEKPVQEMSSASIAKVSGQLREFYNFATRRGQLPDIQIQVLEHDNTRSRQYMVSISLEAFHISVQEHGQSVQKTLEAAIKKCLTTSQDPYHSSNIPKQWTAIRAETALQFIAHCEKISELDFERRIESSKELGGIFEGSVSSEGETYPKKVYGLDHKTTETLLDLLVAIEYAEYLPLEARKWQPDPNATQGPSLGSSERPIDLDLSRASMKAMSNALLELNTHKTAALPADDDVEDSNGTGVIDAQIPFRLRHTPTRAQIERRSRDLKRMLDSFASRPGARALLQARHALPMFQAKDKVIGLIADHAYSVIIGATGSGKTTQVPQILLDDATSRGEGGACNIICTQPRRIAATSVATRVAAERLEQIRDSVGYHVRFDSKLPRDDGSITYCTTGILLQQLQRAPDEVCERISHVVVDEVHERDLQIDFLLNILRRTVRDRRAKGLRVPKIILMSATIDSHLIAQYFSETTQNGRTLKCPTLQVPGRTFPITEKYLESVTVEIMRAHGRAVFARSSGRESPEDKATRDYMQIEQRFSTQSQKFTGGRRLTTAKRDEDDEDDIPESDPDDAIVPTKLVALTIAHLAKTTDQGAMLVFLPGLEELKNVKEMLEDTRPLGVDFGDAQRYKLFMLHSSIPSSEQSQVFEQMPHGCRKIILGTNIAETSITIPEVQYVIDSGKHRQLRYDQHTKITKLECTWISRSNARQRAGRAGRVQNGNYYALYSRARSESLPATGLPEMLRCDLQEICLAIKAQNLAANVESFLASSVEPPSPAAGRAAIDSLKSMQALAADEELTPLGRVLADLPIHPTLGKMVVLGVIFRCLDPMIILAASLSAKSPLLRPMETRDEATRAHRPFTDGSQSDFITMINAVRQVRDSSKLGFHAARQFCFDKFIHHNAVRDILRTADQIRDVLVQRGLIPSLPGNEPGQVPLGGPRVNREASNADVIGALAFASMYPNVGVWQGSSSIRTQVEEAAKLHPESMNHGQNRLKNEGQHPDAGTLCTYSVMARSNDGTKAYLRGTAISSPLLAILFGGRYGREGTTIALDDWLHFKLPKENDAANTLDRYRAALDNALSRAFQMIASVSKKPTESEEDSNLLSDDPVIDTTATSLATLLNEVKKREIQAKSPQRQPPAQKGRSPQRRQGSGGKASSVRHSPAPTQKRRVRMRA